MAEKECKKKNPSQSGRGEVNYKQEYFKLRKLAREMCIAVSFGEYTDYRGSKVEDLKEFDDTNNYINRTMWIELDEDD